MMPARWPVSEDCGKISFVTSSNKNGPKFTGSVTGSGRGNRQVGKHREGRKNSGQNSCIRTLAATIHANKTHEYLSAEKKHDHKRSEESIILSPQEE